MCDEPKDGECGEWVPWSVTDPRFIAAAAALSEPIEIPEEIRKRIPDDWGRSRWPKGPASLGDSPA
jgi:hypothetical protein